MGIIEQADRIVGIDNKISLWCRADQDIYRRGAYFKWIGTKDSRGVRYGADLEIIAAEVVRIHAEEEKSKQPDDGLQPGPWSASRGCPDPSGNNDRGDPYVSDRNMRLVCILRDYATCQYIARCGSPAVRRLLAAFEVTEDKQDGSMGLCCTDSGVCFHVWHTEPLRDHSSVICWLTPRSKP